MALTQEQMDYAQYLLRGIRGETTWADVVVYGRDYMEEDLETDYDYDYDYDEGECSDVEEDCPEEPWDPGRLLPENEEW